MQNIRAYTPFKFPLNAFCLENLVKSIYFRFDHVQFIYDGFIESVTFEIYAMNIERHVQNTQTLFSYTLNIQSQRWIPNKRNKCSISFMGRSKCKTDDSVLTVKWK